MRVKSRLPLYALVATLLSGGSLLCEELVPQFFHVYSSNGRESLTASCEPIAFDESRNAIAVNCRFVTARFSEPDGPLTEVIPLSIDEAIETRPDIRLAWESESVPKEEVRRVFKEGLVQLKEVLCALEKDRNVTADIEVGPKRRAHGLKLLDACNNDDPTVFLREWNALQRNTCRLWIDQWDLDFRRVKEGQWLYRQERPGLLTKVLKIYELTAEGPFWTLRETRVPTQGAEEDPNSTVWSARNPDTYEPRCDFISYDLVQFPSR